MIAVSGYDEDILVWSERQAALLRRLAAGERISDQIDWENVVEEVESVGRDGGDRRSAAEAGAGRVPSTRC